MVEDREHIGFQDAGLGEAAFDHQDRRIREIGFALRVTVDVAGEAEIGQEVQGLLVDHLLFGEEPELRIAEPEIREPGQEPSGAAHHAVPTAFRQPAREDFEDTGAEGGAGMQRRLQHGQFVSVGEQGRAGSRRAEGGLGRVERGHTSTLIRPA